MGHIFAVSIRYTLMGQKDGGRLPLPLFFAMEGEMLMKIGYIRVSTVEQNTIRQETLMEALGVDEIYMDKVSGKNTNRPELQKMLHYVRKGDTVIVESISRFARNTKDLLELVEQLTAKEVEFISQKESIDTSTPAGKFMLTIFAAVAELEREYILQRQREGIAEAKKQGKYHGRKAKIHSDAEKVMKRWREKEITATAAMQLLGVSKTTFYRMVRKFP
jgi:DNA invertase Pin-like site-specific DNA recombinase